MSVKAWFGVAVLAGLVAVSLVVLKPARSQANEKKVRICHATSSHSNPYVSNEPAIANNGDLKGGHLDHTGPVFPAPDWGDIIPPYTFVDPDGVTQVFPGSNWTPDGQAIWQNGCELGPDPMTPLLQCVEVGAGGGFLAHFGYDNPNDQTVTVPFENIFDPLSANGQQPISFDPGRHEDVFQVLSGGEDLTWRLTGNSVTATRSSNRC